MSTRYDPATVKCSPSHATLVNMMNKKLEEANSSQISVCNQANEIGENILSESDCCGYKCRCKIKDTGPEDIKDNEKGKPTQEKNETIDSKKTKRMGKKSCTISESSKNGQSDNDREGTSEVSKTTTQDGTKTDESDVFDDKTEVKDQVQSQETNSKAKYSSKTLKITAYVKKSSKTKVECKNTEHRKATSYSNNNYVVEVENETTDHSSTDNDADEVKEKKTKQTLKDSGIDVRTKSSKRKQKKGSVFKEARSSISLQEDHDLNKLVMDAEEIE